MARVLRSSISERMHYRYPERLRKRAVPGWRRPDRGELAARFEVLDSVSHHLTKFQFCKMNVWSATIPEARTRRPTNP
jgi:hypothetical protein